MYIYESHMGGLYTSDDPLDYEDLYCEECGDSDRLIGYAETREDAWNLFKDDTDIDGSGGWDYDYIQEFINGNWDEQKLNKDFLGKNEVILLYLGEAKENNKGSLMKIIKIVNSNCIQRIEVNL